MKNTYKATLPNYIANYNSLNERQACAHIACSQCMLRVLALCTVYYLTQSATGANC